MGHSDIRRPPNWATGGRGGPKRTALYKPKEQPRAGTNASTGLCIIRVQGTLRRVSSPPPSEQADGSDGEKDEGGRLGDGGAS